MHHSSTRGTGVQTASHLLLAIVTAALAACGGGGGSSSDPMGTSSSMTTSTSATVAAPVNAALPTGSAVSAQGAPAVIRVHADAAGQQTLADVATLHDGGYAIAWLSRLGTGAASVHLQRFDADGRAVGTDLSVALAADETNATVTVLPQGGLALATLQTGSASTDQPWITRTAVVLRRYDASGALLGAPLQVAVIDQDRTTSSAMHYVAAPKLVHWDDGSFLLAWAQVQDDAAGKVPQFWARRFDTTGEPIGLNLPIGTGVAGSALQLAATAKGGFVIATAVSAQGGTWLMYRGFDGAFSPVLPADALGAAEGSALLPLQGGAQVLVSPVKNTVAMQLYDARGLALGAGMALRAMPVAMTALRDGGYVLVLPADGGTLRARHYDASGRAVGSEQAIAGSAYAAQGAALGDGSLALAWTANNAGDQDVMATRIAP